MMQHGCIFCTLRHILNFYALHLKFGENVNTSNKVCLTDLSVLFCFRSLIGRCDLYVEKSSKLDQLMTVHFNP